MTGPDGVEPDCRNGVHGRFPVLTGWHEGCTVNGSEIADGVRFTHCRITPTVDVAEARRRFELGIEESDLATALRFGLPLPDPRPFRFNSGPWV